MRYKGFTKREEWFIEKYDPSTSETLSVEKRLEIQKVSKRFFSKYEAHEFDSLNLEISEEQYEEILSLEANSHIQKDQKNTEESAHLQYTSEIIVPPSFSVLGQPYFGFDPACLTLFINRVPRDCPREDLFLDLSKLEGRKRVTIGFVGLSFSEPLKTQDFIRFGWVIFESEETCDKALVAIADIMKKLNLNISKSKSGKRFIKVLPMLSKQRLDHHISLSQHLIGVMDAEQGIENNPIFGERDGLTDLFRLDLQILYLRRVHSYCYFSAAVDMVLNLGMQR